MNTGAAIAQFGVVDSSLIAKLGYLPYVDLRIDGEKKHDAFYEKDVIVVQDGIAIQTYKTSDALVSLVLELSKRLTVMETMVKQEAAEPKPGKRTRKKAD